MTSVTGVAATINQLKLLNYLFETPIENTCFTACNITKRCDTISSTPLSLRCKAREAESQVLLFSVGGQISSKSSLRAHCYHFSRDRMQPIKRPSIKDKNVSAGSQFFCQLFQFSGITETLRLTIARPSQRKFQFRVTRITSCRS